MMWLLVTPWRVWQCTPYSYAWHSSLLCGISRTFVATHGGALHDIIAIPKIWGLICWSHSLRRSLIGTKTRRKHEYLNLYLRLLWCGIIAIPKIWGLICWSHSLRRLVFGTKTRRKHEYLKQDLLRLWCGIIDALPWQDTLFTIALFVCVNIVGEHMYTSPTMCIEYSPAICLVSEYGYTWPTMCVDASYSPTMHAHICTCNIHKTTTHEWVMPTWMIRVTHMSKSCHTLECVMSRKGTRHV